MAVYQTTRGWGIDLRDEYGTRKRFHVGTEQAAHATEAMLTQQINDRRAKLRLFQTTLNLSLIDAIDLYLASYNAAHTTRTETARKLATFARAIGNQPLAQITPRLIESWLEQRRQTANPNSVACYLGAVKSLFAWLTESATIPSNPAAAFKVKRIPSNIGKALTDKEQAAILLAATHRAYPRVLLGLDAGLRSSEVLLLRKNHYAPNDRALTVWSTKTRTTRTIPTTDRLHTALLEQIANLTNPDAHIFQRQARAIPRMDNMTDTLRLRSDVQFRFHDLRHTFATRIANACAQLRQPRAVIRQLLGHAPTTTTEFYEHATWEQLQAAVKAMEEATHKAQQQKEANPDGQ